MREQVNKVKNWKQFLNENVSNISIEKILNEIIDINKQKNKILKSSGYDNYYDYLTLENGRKTTIHDYLYETNNNYKELSDKWKELIGIGYNHYKNILNNEFNNFGKDKTKEKFYDIKKYLLQYEEYEEASAVILFDLSSFVVNLLKGV